MTSRAGFVQAASQKRVALKDKLPIRAVVFGAHGAGVGSGDDSSGAAGECRRACLCVYVCMCVSMPVIYTRTPEPVHLF